jgi:hypothetical protein
MVNLEPENDANQTPTEHELEAQHEIFLYKLDSIHSIKLKTINLQYTKLHQKFDLTMYIVTNTRVKKD